MRGYSLTARTEDSKSSYRVSTTRTRAKFNFPSHYLNLGNDFLING